MKTRHSLLCALTVILVTACGGGEPDCEWSAYGPSSQANPLVCDQQHPQLYCVEVCKK